jgi:bacteriorhodopsin
MTRQLNVGMALMGLVGFAVLMALRSEVSGMVARSALAALAFICAAMALAYISKAWR